MSYHLLAENTSQAAAFNTDCSRCIRDPDTPVDAERHMSSFVTTSARIGISNASCVIEHLTLHICHSAAKHGLTVAVMWALMVT